VKLHSPSFEKQVRRKAKRKLKASPELKPEIRAARRLRKQYQAALVVRPLVSLVLAAGVREMWVGTGQVAPALALLTLWGMLFVLLHAQRLMLRLYGSSDLRALATLPVTESAVFRWELQKFFKGTLWSLADFVLAFGVLAWHGRFSAGQWCAGIALPLLAWLMGISLAALCVTHFPRIPYQLASAVMTLTTFFLVMAHDFTGRVVVPLLVKSAPTLNLIVPTGWPATLFQVILSGRTWTAVWLLVPTAIILWSLRDSLLRLLADYRFTEPLLPQAADLVPGNQFRAARPGDLPEAPARLGQTEIEELIQSGKFLEPPEWPKEGGPIEKSFWSRCRPREKALAEFVFPNALVLTRKWRNIFRNLAIACLAGLGAHFVDPRATDLFLGAGLFITLCQMLVCLFNSGRAFGAVHHSGVNIPVYANYPIGFQELGTFLFKYSLSQLPVMLLFTPAAGVLLFHLCGWPLAAGALCGIKAGALLLASRFILLALSFSSGTNDTSRIRIRSVLLVLVTLTFGLGFAALSAASLLLPGQVAAWSCWTAALLVPHAFFRVYGWFFHRNNFDLIKLPQR
jgi:hypothetical protein